jgi:hypothetical protein
MDIKELRKITLDDDAIGLACYVDIEHVPKSKADRWFKEIDGFLKSRFPNVEIIVLPSSCRLEVITATKEIEVEESD